MNALSQISMNFIDEPSVPEEAVQPVMEDQPVNVGIRLKKLKSAEPLRAEAETTEEKISGPADVPLEISFRHILPAENTAAVAPPVETVQKIKSGRGRKSIKQISEEADLIQIPEDEILFQKQYYTMGEVSEMFRVNQSLLRFWEAEFSVLQPKKNKKGDRYFRPVDIKNLHLIYHLLRQKKYTIEGAKDFLKNSKKSEEKFDIIKRMEEMKRFLLEMKASLQ